MCYKKISPRQTKQICPLGGVGQPKDNLLKQKKSVEFARELDHGWFQKVLTHQRYGG